MNSFIKILFLIAFIFPSKNIKAQDKLLFLNGRELEGKLLKKTNYEYTFLTNKNKQFTIDRYRLFSYTEDNKETIVYEFDTLSGNFLKVNDMKLFVYGEKDAQEFHQSNFTNIAGLVAGGISGYFIHKEQTLIYSPTPIVYTVITLPFGTRVKQKKLTDLQYIKEDEYLRGYERVAKGKRTQNALKSSFIGMAGGFLISLIIN